LIELGADINCGSTDGCSPLCFAIMHSKTDTAKLLLEKGASPVGAEGAKMDSLDGGSHGEEQGHGGKVD
jgi:ankyrin repeat protein